MLQYLLNCSAIWLLSLLCYDVFLKRNTFHSYNRIYLLGTLLAGILIPLLSFESRQMYQQQVRTNTMVEQTIEAKKTIVGAAQVAPAGHSIDWLFWVMIVYSIGCLISLLFIAKELFSISLLYARGRKESTGASRIVLTGKSHSPFSFCGRIFLSDKERYSEAQLNMILAHEQKHIQLFHSADVLVLTLCNTLFWFHPLPYLYRQRLLLLHEYQADSVVDSPLPEYGTFLMEQSLLARTPFLTHSFNRSPLKKRIMMLTRKPATWSKSKLFIALPVLTISLLCFSKNAFSDFKRVRKGNKVTVNGNEFELKVFPQQKMQYKDPQTGKIEESTFEIVPYPFTMNGKPLADKEKVDKTPSAPKKLNEYIMQQFTQHKNLFAQLNDGTYFISIIHFVTGKNGEVLYFLNDGVKNNQNVQLPGTNEWQQQAVNPVNVKDKIDQLMDKMAVNIKFTPAIKDGQAVPCLTAYGDGAAPFYFTVKNHVAYEGKFAPGVHKMVHRSDNGDTLEIMDVEFLPK